MIILQKEKEDSELKVMQNMINFKLKEDEIDTLLIAIDGIFVYFTN